MSFLDFFTDITTVTDFEGALLLIEISEAMDPSWVTKARGKVVILAEGEDHPPQKYQDHHTDPHPFPIIQRGGMSLKIIHYSLVRAYLSQKQSDTFIDCEKKKVDDIRSMKGEKKNPGRYSGDIYLADYTSGRVNTKLQAYFETILTNTELLNFKDFSGLGYIPMKESGRPDKIPTNFTY
ncbi:hypothetical protein H5410_025444 [Solanum commersonii]|uniref:Uncharacterized protein n=1 Tax=Solanum commersonii TaxID=4109 RepID=A0A9J5YVX1_SOLCO|nr:hypothetical protein H5410_025444 [Solanum commersonii]